MKKIICFIMCFVLIFGFSPMQANAKKKVKVKCTIINNGDYCTLKIKNKNKYDVVVKKIVVKLYKDGKIVEKIDFPDTYKVKKNKTKKDKFEIFSEYNSYKITYKCTKKK